MLTFLLVWTVALGSLSIFLAGMIFPELSRKNDLIWVGIGLFYALILWANAGKMGGGLLLGQTAGVSMMVWLGWQAMTQRRELTEPDKKTPVPDWLQKIIDFVVPLWQKAYGAIAGQLGLEEGSAEGEEALSGLKSKTLGFLDKLNNKPDAALETPVEDDSAEDDSAADVPPGPEEAQIAEATVVAEDAVETAEELVEEDVEAAVSEEAVSEEREETAVEEPQTEEPQTEEPVAEDQAGAEPVAAPVAETGAEPTEMPQPPEPSPAEKIPEPVAVETPVEEPVAPDVPESEAAPVEEPTPPDVSQAEPQATPETVEPPGTTAPEDSNWPEEERVSAEETAQEESNWPPEDPVD